MMYLFDFVRYVFGILQDGMNFLSDVGGLALNVCNSFLNLVSAFPLWLSIPFTTLISIAVLFRVSQFIPTIGGAK